MVKTIYEALRDDHDSQRALLEEIARNATDPEERHALLADLEREMRSHARAEEEAFHASLLEHPRAREVAARSIREHVELRAEVEELDAIGSGGSTWLDAFREWRRRVETHLATEERTLFRLAENVLSDTQAFALAARYQREKRAALRDDEAV